MNLYIVVVYGGLCKKGGKESCSQWRNTYHNIDVIWCLSFTAETLDFLYQYGVECCMLSEVEWKQFSSSSNYIESFHYFNYKVSVMFGTRLRIMVARILKYVTTRSGCNTASCYTVIFVSHGVRQMGLTSKLVFMKCAVLLFVSYCCCFLCCWCLLYCICFWWSLYQKYSCVLVLDVFSIFL